MKTNDDYAQFPGPGEIRLMRTLPGPAERLWQYLTDPEKRARWFAGGPMEPRTGGKMELFFRHENIAPGEKPPADYAEVQDPGFRMPGTILRWDPPRVLSYTFSEDSDVTFELIPQDPAGKTVLLILTHRSRGTDLPEVGNFAGGWHTHLAILIALLEGKQPPAFWATHARLKSHYEKQLPPAP